MNDWLQPALNYIPQWFYYFGGLADKIEGRVIPIDRPGVFNFTREEPLGVVAAIILVYLGARPLSDRIWWIPLTDALQLPVSLIVSTWLGSRLHAYDNART